MKPKNKTNKQSPLINPFDESNIKPKKHWKVKTAVIVLLVIASIIGINAFFNRYFLVSPIIFQNPVRIRGTEYPINIKESELDKIIIESIEKECPKEKVEPVKTRENKDTSSNGKSQWTGQASVYTEEGCLGCDPNLIMANGEKLDDKKLTVAFNKLPLNSKVRITNKTNGLFVEARVTDTGGFEKYNRIVDLNLATAEAINCKGLCNVNVEEI